MRAENEKFIDWFNSLKSYERTYYRRLLEEACDVSRATVCQWLKGDIRIKNPYKRIINSLSGEELFPVGLEYNRMVRLAE